MRFFYLFLYVTNLSGHTCQVVSVYTHAHIQQYIYMCVWVCMCVCVSLCHVSIICHIWSILLINETLLNTHHINYIGDIFRDYIYSDRQIKIRKMDLFKGSSTRVYWGVFLIILNKLMNYRSSLYIRRDLITAQCL